MDMTAWGADKFIFPTLFFQNHPEEQLLWRPLLYFVISTISLGPIPKQLSSIGREPGGVCRSFSNPQEISSAFCVRPWSCLLKNRKTHQRVCCCILWTQRLPPSQSCCVSLERGTWDALWASVCSSLATGWCMAAADLPAVAPCLRELRYTTHGLPSSRTLQFSFCLQFIISLDFAFLLLLLSKAYTSECVLQNGKCIDSSGEKRNMFFQIRLWKWTKLEGHW